MKLGDTFVILAVGLLLLNCGLGRDAVEMAGPDNTPTPVLVEVTATASASQEPASVVTPTARLEDTASPSLDVNPARLYLSERYKGRSFVSPKEWRQVFEHWREKRPPHPGVWEAIEAFSIALKSAKKIEGGPSNLNDKWKHCVIGSTLAAEVSLQAAEFIAWLKEYQDLVDGFRETTFDEVDFEATVDGAKLSTEAYCEDCAVTCEARWAAETKHGMGSNPTPNERSLPLPRNLRG